MNYKMIATRNPNGFSFVTVDTSTHRVLSTSEAAEALSPYGEAYLAQLEREAEETLLNLEERVRDVTTNKHYPFATMLEAYCNAFGRFVEALEAGQPTKELRQKAQNFKNQLSDQEFVWAGHWEHRLTKRNEG